MTQSERREFLISRLLEEQSQCASIKMPKDAEMQKKLLRSLFNIRLPKDADNEFIKIQNEYLQCETREKPITKLSDLMPVKQGIYLWQGDITALKVDAIVNAANSRMLGCFQPCHGCIDNAIHTYAGIQLRNECHAIMEEKRRIYGDDYEVPTGVAIVTKGYNLPCCYVIHTVGPIVSGQLLKKDRDLLYSCYRSCLEMACRYDVESIAFCCISTGEFRFPNEEAAVIAVKTTEEFLKSSKKRIEVVFNVFKYVDYKIYDKLFS